MPRGVDRVLVMGVAGCGKSTVASALAQRLNGARGGPAREARGQRGGTPSCWVLIEADEHHPASNRAKMSRGEALTDADREPWLARLVERMEQTPPGVGVVLACSALKRAYRERLYAAETWRWGVVHLEIERSAAEWRVGTRAATGEHFMSAELVASQFATLEAPESHEAERVTVLDGERRVTEIVRCTDLFD